MTAYRETLEGIYAKAVSRDEDAQRAFTARHLAEMNSVAEAFTEQGPADHMTGMAAFLFAMHGIHHDWRKLDMTAEQMKYEQLASLFDMNALAKTFALPDDMPRDGGRPTDLYASPRWLFDEKMKDGIEGDFSALEYTVEKDHGVYIGSIAVPAVVLKNFSNMDSIETSPHIQEGTATLVRLGRNTNAASPTPRYYDKDSQPIFGALIANWAKDEDLRTYEKEISAVVKADSILRPVARRHSRPKASLSSN